MSNYHMERRVLIVGAKSMSERKTKRMPKSTELNRGALFWKSMLAVTMLFVIFAVP